MGDVVQFRPRAVAMKPEADLMQPFLPLIVGTALFAAICWAFWYNVRA